MGKFTILIYITSKAEVIILVIRICLHEAFTEAACTSEQIEIFNALSG
ncbi:hypothetical protein LDZ44_05475 [Bacteroides xylanisolvens]|nr:hypothetical protein [Bacteroides xylanisolvens]MCA4464656.1 hypothetical protein [Bacteroides xylanisolvens]MCA4487636.1 hypothetical protein [Bacteroides xylanisolvens]